MASLCKRAIATLRLTGRASQRRPPALPTRTGWATAKTIMRANDLTGPGRQAIIPRPKYAISRQLRVYNIHLKRVRMSAFFTLQLGVLCVM